MPAKLSHVLTLSSYNADMSKLNKSKTGNYHHGNLREALIRTAMTILEEDGVEALTLRRVARDTGVSQAAPYSHFRDKNDLVTSVCLEGTKWFGEYMSREAAGREGPDYLAGLAIGHIRFALDHRALFRLMSTTDISDAVENIADGPKVLTEGYLMLASGLAVSPLLHFGSEQQQLDIPLAWGQVYGLTNLLVEGRITPQAHGFDDLESFVVALVNRFLKNPPANIP